MLLLFGKREGGRTSTSTAKNRRVLPKLVQVEKLSMKDASLQAFDVSRPFRKSAEEELHDAQEDQARPQERKKNRHNMTQCTT